MMDWNSEKGRVDCEFNGMRRPEGLLCFVAGTRENRTCPLLWFKKWPSPVIVVQTEWYKARETPSVYAELIAVMIKAALMICLLRFLCVAFYDSNCNGYDDDGGGDGT